MQAIATFYSRLFADQVVSEAPTLAHTREVILFAIVQIAAVLGAVAYLPSVWAGWQGGLVDIVVIDTIFYGLLLWLAFARISYRVRTYGLLLPLWALAVYLLFRFGSEGAGYLWLFTAPVLAGLLLSRRLGIALLIMNLGIVALAPILVYAGYLPWGNSPHQTPMHWLLMGGNFLLLNTLVTVSVATLTQGLERSLESLRAKSEELALTQEATIETVSSLAEFRDAETGHHIARTQHYVRELAQGLAERPDYAEQLPPDQVELLAKSAPLHDIGKVGIPDQILLKPGRLTADEFEEMKQHPTLGRDALLRSERKLGGNNFLRLAAEIAYSHQERWDGSGYPESLSGKDIPLSGRIMAVADVYDALVSRRVYKPPMPHDEAIAYLQHHAGRLFDPDVVAVMLAREARILAIAIEYADSDEERRSLERE